MSIHILVRFEPQAGKEEEFREALLRVIPPTQAEPGCIGIQAFESLRQPFTFAIHSEWMDEPVFDLHATLPHTVEFIRVAKELLTHEVQALRLRGVGTNQPPMNTDKRRLDLELRTS